MATRPVGAGSLVLLAALLSTCGGTESGTEPAASFVNPSRPSSLHRVFVTSAETLLAIDGAGRYQRLLRSDDGGTTWTRLDAPPSPLLVLGAAERRLLLAVQDKADTVKLFQSGDDGRSWVPCHGQSGNWVWIEPAVEAAPGQWWTTVLTKEGAVSTWRSSDGGVSWSEFQPRLSGSSVMTVLQWQWLASNPQEPGRMVASAVVKTNGSSLLRLLASADGGTSWSSSALPSPFVTQGLDRTPEQKLVTIDGQGDIWTSAAPWGGEWMKSGTLPVDEVSTGGSGKLRATGLRARGSDLFVPVSMGIGEFGLMHSADAGATWRFADRRTMAGTYAFTSGGRIFALGPHLRVTTDAGRSWSALAHSTTAMTMIATGDSAPGLYLLQDRVLLRSDDQGQSWSASATPESFNEVVSVPGRTTELYARGSRSLYASEDRGVTWRKLDFPDFSALSIVALGGELPAVLVGSGGGLRRSTDGGLTWATPGRAISRLATTAGSPDLIIAAGIERLRSRDRGLTWEPFGPAPTENSYRLFIDPHDPETVYELTYGGGDFLTLWRFRGNAAAVPLRKTWSAVRTEVQGLLALSPSRPGTLFFIAEAKGLLRSDDAGQTWRSVAALEGLSVNSVVFDPADPRRLYVVMDGGTMYLTVD